MNEQPDHADARCGRSYRDAAFGCSVMRPALYPILFGGFSLRAYLASVSGSLYNFTDTTTLPGVSAIGDAIGDVVDTVNARNGVQASGTLKPTLQTTGAKFDGTDDNLLTSYLAGATNNFIVALVSVPASIASFQYMVGAVDGSSNRFGIGNNTDGTAGFAAGATSPVTQKGTSDLRGTETVVGLTSNGATVLGFAGASQEYSGAVLGSLTTAVPLRLGCNNSNGTAANFSSGSIKRIVAGRDYLSLSRYNQIRNALLAA